MNQTAHLHRSVPKKPVANRTISPDLSTRHTLTATKGIDIKSTQDRRGRVPLVQDITALSNQNYRLKEILAQQARKEAELKQREFLDLKERIGTKNKLTVTLHDSFGGSFGQPFAEKRRDQSAVNPDPNSQLQQLKGRNQVLEKQNQDLRRNLITRGVHSQRNQSRSRSQQKLQQDLISSMNQKFQQLQSYTQEKVKKLGLKVEGLEAGLRIVRSRSNSKQKLSLISPLKRERSSSRLQTGRGTTVGKPAHQEQVSRFLSNQKSEGKNRLERQNQLLLEENASLKKALSHLSLKLKVEQDRKLDGSLINNLGFDTQPADDAKYTIEKLERENQDLRLKMTAIQYSYIGVKRDMGRISESKAPDSFRNYRLDQVASSGYQLASRVSQLQNQKSVLIKQRDALRSQMFNPSKRLSSDDKPYDSIDKLEEERARLFNHTQQMEYSLNSTIRAKQGEIARLGQQLAKALAELNEAKSGNSVESEGLKRQLDNVKSRLDETDLMLDEVSKLDTKNKKELQISLRNLEDMQRKLHLIDFEPLETNLRQLGSKYQLLVQEKIRLLKGVKQTNSQVSRLTAENDKIKKEVLESNLKYVNERSQKERLLSLLQQQKDQGRILRGHADSLQAVFDQYINTKTVQLRNSQLEESLVWDMNPQAAKRETQKSIDQLREVEREFEVVSSRLDQITTKMNLDMNSRRESRPTPVRFGSGSNQVPY